MGRIQKLPFILGCGAAIIAGAASYAAGLRNQALYLRMAVIMLLFFVVGLYIRSTVLSVSKEIKLRKAEEAKEEELREKRLKEQHAGKAHVARSKPAPQQGATARKVDMTVGNEEDAFEPLKLSKAIKTKVKE